MERRPAVTVRIADWVADRAALRSVREAVFVREQSVPLELEWDEFDAASRHVLAWHGSEPVGTGRLLPDGHIGRMAVLRDWRGSGVGSALLVTLMDLARAAGMRTVALNAQTQAMPFYTHHGFAAEGEEFLEAGIPHRHMHRQL